ncbi:hypothetical protein LY624_17115 [Pseudoalteromonas sp. N1230-9]|uniref:hypothetical protein n=1 Tax=Pseudoalteromonas sp. N1230-9 TaxID=2907156 RepID=UPI002B2B6A4E|nr:hypothetical protein LY624_17115 [Pseudoalteromonas sp. N1230-9]
MDSNKICILYVDEETDQLADFQADAELSDLFDQVLTIEPRQNLAEMVDEILTLKVDAVISDFALNEAAIVDYNGDQLLNAIQSVRHNFPCFLRTSFEDDAVSHSSDVNRVYVKADSLNLHSQANLFQRVAAQVKSYNRMYHKMQQEHFSLRDKLSKQGLSSIETERLIELDDILESYLSAEQKTPSEVKRIALDKFDKLMESTDNLISEIESKLDGNTLDV